MLEELSAFDLAVTSFDLLLIKHKLCQIILKNIKKVADYKDWLADDENNPEDFFVVTGSLYFISEVRNFLLNQ